eukprot:2108002-Rhodomonas_salina.2
MLVLRRTLGPSWCGCAVVLSVDGRVLLAVGDALRLCVGCTCVRDVTDVRRGIVCGDSACVSRSCAHTRS